MRLETRRLVLRLPCEEDVDSYFAIHSDPESMKYWWEPAWTERAQAEQRIVNLTESHAKGDSLPLTILMKDSGDPIGMACLFRFMVPSRRAEIGYVIARSHWGQGLATEAVAALLEYGFTDLHLNRVEADIDPQNMASARLLTKLGFKLEGILKERWLVGERPSDSGLYGLLAQDWFTVSRLRLVDPAQTMNPG